MDYTTLEPVEVDGDRTSAPTVVLPDAPANAAALAEARDNARLNELLGKVQQTLGSTEKQPAPTAFMARQPQSLRPREFEAWQGYRCAMEYV